MAPGPGVPDVGGAAGGSATSLLPTSWGGGADRALAQADAGAVPAALHACRELWGLSFWVRAFPPLPSLPTLCTRGAVLTRSSPSGRYDTGVIAGALPYLRDTLLKDYESDAARCAPPCAPLAAARSAACAALLAGAGHPLKTLSPGRRRRAGPSADRPASAHAASVPPPPAPGPTSPAGWAQQQAPAPPALDRSRTSR